MVKDAPLSFRIDAAMKTALESAAKADGRSVSGMVARILHTWLTENGHLAAPAPAKPARKKGKA